MEEELNENLRGNRIAGTDVDKYSWTSIRDDIKVSLALKDLGNLGG